MQSNTFNSEPLAEKDPRFKLRAPRYQTLQVGEGHNEKTLPLLGLQFYRRVNIPVHFSDTYAPARPLQTYSRALRSSFTHDLTRPDTLEGLLDIHGVRIRLVVKVAGDGRVVRHGVVKEIGIAAVLLKERLPLSGGAVFAEEALALAVPVALVFHGLLARALPCRDDGFPHHVF